MNRDSHMTVAVLRGGKEGHGMSISSGYGMLDSLARMGIDSLDIYIDEEGIWYSKGVVVEPHTIFSQVDGYIDTTSDLPTKYKDLAKRMGVEKMLWNHKEDYHKNRETVYRLLRQKGISVPETEVVRVKEGVSLPDLHRIWKKLHTPYIARPLIKHVSRSSELITSFDDFKRVAEKYAEDGVDFHVLTYRGTPTISTAVVPEYRGEHLYVPLSVTTLLGKRDMPNDASKVIVYRSHQGEYEEIKSLLIKVYDTLLLKDPALIDMVKTKDGFMVVEVQTTPSLKEHGRFMQSLKSTGAEIAKYIMDSFPDLSKKEYEGVRY